ncbi:MAG: LytTR family DNA-binding domain-containing protein [Nitratireductor sp.]
MKEPVLQFTLREMRNIYTSPKFWITMIAIIVILGASAPFGSAQNFSPLQLFFYWGGIALSTFSVASFLLISIPKFLEQRSYNVWTARIIAILLASFVIGLTVFFINAFIVKVNKVDWWHFTSILSDVYLTAVPIALIFFVLGDALRGNNQDTQKDTSTSTSPFYARYSKALGKDIISLNAQDHYVEVATTKGKELVLIRLADAVSELANIKGQQVHRSWWIAQEHITNFSKKDGRLNLTLSNETNISVSRSYLKQTRQMLEEIDQI